MTKYLFVAQQTIAAWLEQEKISFVDNIMTIKSDGRQFRLQEAVRFINLEEGEDVPGLVGKVKTLDQLAVLKAERCHDSVIFQDAAYKVQEGFVGEVMLKDTTPQSPVPAPAQPAPTDPFNSEKAGAQPTNEKESNGSASDEELLTRFLLKNL